MSNERFPAGACMVFGGSGGIGQAVVRQFAKAGSPVAIVYRRKEETAQKLADSIRAEGGRASIHAADVTQGGSVKDAVDQAIAEHGRLHTIVFGAGPVVEQLDLADTPESLWRQSLETETLGFLNVVRATLPHLRESQGGSYVHLGSAGDLWWPQKDGLSVAPKAANEAVIRGLAKEEGVNNIRANSVLVGVIEAGMFLELLERGVFDDHWIKETQKLLALKRWGRGEDIGEAAVFLASNQAAYITGQQLNVSGGFGV